MANIITRITNRISASFQDKRARYIVSNYNKKLAPKANADFSVNIKQTAAPSNFTNYYSATERTIEIQDRDFALDEVILTCYFTKKADPQLGIIRNTADIKYIAPWYESVVKLRLKGVVVHDGLEEAFIEKYQNEFVQFRKYVAGNYSIFEERWVAYYLFLSKATSIKRAFFTDANDVYITANPFSFATAENILYVGRDNANRVRHTGWLLQELETFEKDSGYKSPQSFLYQPVYNAGVVGGSRAVLLFFISKMIGLLLKTQTNYHKDMTLVNLVIHDYFSPTLTYSANEAKLTDPENDLVACAPHLFSGFPLNSGFKKFEFESKAIFIHK